MFERAGELFAEYEGTAAKSNVPVNKTATSELRERLRYLDMTVEMVREAVSKLSELQEAANQSMRGDTYDREDWDRWFAQADKTRILTETFYFNCGRIGELLKDPKWIPHVGDPGFIGVYQVRHKLVEHYDPEQSPVEQGPSFSVSSDVGPSLQAGMSRDWIDKGLYPNAQELAGVLERRFANAIEKIRPAAE